MLYFGLHWSEKSRVAPTILLTNEQERELAQLARSKRTSVRLAQRAQIVLLAAQGLQNKNIAEQPVALFTQLCSEGNLSFASYATKPSTTALAATRTAIRCWGEHPASRSWLI